MKKTFFVCAGKSIADLMLIIAGIIFSMAMVILPFVFFKFNLIIYAVFLLVSLIALRACANLVNKGALANVVITEDGIGIRKLFKSGSFIKWDDVTRAETAKIDMYPVVMIAVEGYDEYTKEDITIYVEDKKAAKALIKQNLKNSKKAK